MTTQLKDILEDLEQGSRISLAGDQPPAGNMATTVATLIASAWHCVWDYQDADGISDGLQRAVWHLEAARDVLGHFAAKLQRIEDAEAEVALAAARKTA